jgi:hypothetical protein
MSKAYLDMVVPDPLVSTRNDRSWNVQQLLGWRGARRALLKRLHSTEEALADSAIVTAKEDIRIMPIRVVGLVFQGIESSRPVQLLASRLQSRRSLLEIVL